MSSPNWLILKCSNCKSTDSAIAITRWGFDKDWTLNIEGVCRHCFQRYSVTHTREEQAADVRESYNHWRESGGEEAQDFNDWEHEIGEDDVPTTD